MCVCVWLFCLSYPAGKSHLFCAVLYSSVTHHAEPCLPHYLTNNMSFGNKFIENKMCVLIFSTPLVWNISHSKKNSATYCHKCTSSLHVKYPLLLSDCNEICHFPYRFSYSHQISHFKKISPVRAEIFYVDRHKKTSFSQFCKHT